jgi:predicted dehydrogenase
MSRPVGPQPVVAQVNAVQRGARTDRAPREEPGHSETDLAAGNGSDPARTAASRPSPVPAPAPAARPVPSPERVSLHAAAAPATAGDQHRTLRLGVVGVGYWGAKHVRALEKVDGVSAVVAIDERLADEPDSWLATAGIAQYADLEAALPHVDALVIATPPSTHAGVGLRAIAAGKHVLIEKPLATNAAEARSLIEAADAAGVVLMSGHTFEHNAAVHKLRDLVRGRDLGQLYYLDCARLNLGLYRDDVGVIADLAPHDISIANYVLSSRPTQVTAWGSRFVGPEHEDVAFLRLDYGDIGVRASIQVSWLSPVKVRRVTAVGSQRMAVYDDLAEDERIRVYDKSAVPAARAGGEQRMTYHTGDTIMPHVEFAEPLAVQDQEFVSCIRSGRKPGTDGTSGLSVVQVLDAAQISVREQRPVSIAELNRAPAAGTPLRLAGDPPLRSA